MITSRYLIVSTFAFLSTAAAAGTFDGPSVKAAISINAAQTTLTNYSPDGKVADTKAAADFSLNYSKSYGGFNLAGGLFATLGNQNSGALRSFNQDTGGVWSDSFKLKNLWGISIEPGYNLNDSVLAYAKFSIARATGHNDYNYVVDNDAGSASAKHSGNGIGAGVKFKISNELYGFMEIEQIKFNNKSYYDDVPESYKPSLVKAAIGIGYKF